MSVEDVAAALIAYGRELDEAGAAQVGGGFSGDSEADALLEQNPNAFLIGVLFTQGIPAERAWAGPQELLKRVGTLDPAWLAAHPAEVREAFQRPPMLHRFKETLPRWVVSSGARLIREFDGDAARIWPEGARVIDVIERLARFDGIGRKKAVMATEILMRHFRVNLIGRECGTVAYDVQVRRVFLRSGLVNEDSVEAVESAASTWCPASPGTLDLPAWLIGRETCRPKAPACEECRLGEVCPRLVERTPAGVGARRRTGP